MRAIFVVAETAREHFWQKIDDLAAGKDASPPKSYSKALHAALPDPAVDLIFRPRSAGLGSLGRPRWVGIGDWKGGKVVREAKAALPSAWTMFHGRSKGLRCYEIATGRYRAPDPWYNVKKGIVVRRLSPNNRKLDTEHTATVLAGPKMLHAMGHDLAAIHLGSADRRAAIERDLHRRKPDWFHRAVAHTADAVRKDQAKWAREYGRWKKEHAPKRAAKQKR
jgi:hypothetical protein